MLNRIILLLFLCFSFSVFSQNKISIKGKVTEKSAKLPLESATVYLSAVKDSSVIAYTISDKNGNFEFQQKKIEQPFYVKISFIGFKIFSKRYENALNPIELGNIEMEEEGTVLDDVIIKTEIPPVRIKKDTLEFNASSFKVRPDANLEALLKQLPGVEIDEEGKITVNGKAVNNILINGKPFFDKDGKIALQNLPAEIINKVQVTDTKTKAEELSGSGTSSNEKTINITIQEDKNKGFFGKIMGGYGSNDRYESSLLLNAFKGDRKISVLASSNNINSTGFSMDKVFDNMGGGRNRFFNNSVNQNGITQSNITGINYQDKFSKKTEANGSYYFSNTENNNQNKTAKINLLPEGKTFTQSLAVSNNINNRHNANVSLDIRIDSTAFISVAPKFSKSLSKNRYKSNLITTNENGDELNQSNTDSYSENDTYNFNNSLYFHKKFNKKRSIWINTETEFGKNDNFSTANSQTLFQGAAPDDIRKQNRFDTSDKTNINGELGYLERITDSLGLYFKSDWAFIKNNNKRNTFDYDAVSAEYSIFNDLQSNVIGSEEIKYAPQIGLNIQTKKITGVLFVGSEFTSFKANSDYLGITTNLSKNYVFPKISGYLYLVGDASKNLWANYDYNVDVPSANELLPVENLANPLNTITGNPDLKPTKRHNLYFNYNTYDIQSLSSLSTYGGFSSQTDQIVSSTVYNSSFKAVTTYENIDFGYNFYMGLSYRKSFKKEKRTFAIGGGFSAATDYSQGLTNAELFQAQGYRVTPKMNFMWSIDQMITISPRYQYSFYNTNYKNYIISNAQNFIHNAAVEITSYLPRNFVTGGDFSYTYNSNIADGFKKDFYLCNISIGYNFFKDRLLAKVKVYDLLNQNINTRRTITPTAITDTGNTVLRRYVMFSLTYKIEQV